VIYPKQLGLRPGGSLHKNRGVDS